MRPPWRRLTQHLADLAAETRRANEGVRALTERLDALTYRVAEIDFELAARPYTADGVGLERTDPDGTQYLGFEAGSTGSYATFEDVFRGSEEFIRERLQPYVSLLADHAPVLDVGCGRGELLSLLAASGITATGVDLDDSMLERAQAAGLEVVRADALEHLRSLPADSLGGVVSVQVVEHLPVTVLRELMRESLRVLREGGVFIAETVNPHSPAALKVFWLDLTHVRPLFPESLLLLAEETGFSRGRILFPTGDGDLGRDMRIRGEYALVAYR